MISDIGADVYKSWTEEQRREEIGKLVQGYRNGLPVPILCMTATAIAGSEDLAKEHIAAFISLEERQAIICKEAGDNDELRSMLSSFLI